MTEKIRKKIKEKSIDISKDICPITFVKTRLALESLKDGDTLCVYLSGGEPLKNVPLSAKNLGYSIISSTKHKNDIYKLIIKKPEKS